MSQYEYLSVRGRIYVAGIHWQYFPVSGIRGLRLRAKASHASHWIAIHSHSGTQSGKLLGTLNDVQPYPKGQRYYSLALALLPALSVNSYAIFPLDNSRYWFMAVQNGMLSVFSDVTGTMDAIVQHRDNFLRLIPHEQELISYLPDSLATENSLPLPDIQALLEHKDSSVRRNQLKRVNGHATLRWLGGGIVLAAFFISSYRIWQNQRESQRIEEAQIALLARQRTHATQPQPWQSLPPFKERVSACLLAWRKLPVFIAQWQLSEVSCQADSSLHMTYVMQSGSVDAFSERLRHYFGSNVQPQFNIPGPANIAYVTLPLVSNPVTKNNVDQHPINVEQLVSFAQSLKLALNIASDSSMVTTLPPHPVKEIGFTLVTQLSPEQIIHYPLFNNTHLRATQIQVKNKGFRLEYTLSGILYEN